MKKVRFLTFFLKKFENRLKTALFKIDKFELMLVLETKQKTARCGVFCISWSCLITNLRTINYADLINIGLEIDNLKDKLGLVNLR